MSSVVVLTPQVRKIPYFSSFSDDEKEVVVPIPFVNESLINYNKVRTKQLEKINTENLIKTIEARAYIGLNNGKLLKELLWRLGESEEKMKIIEKLSNTIKSELDHCLKKENYEYIYGIRCRVKSYENTIKFGHLRLVMWAREKKYLSDFDSCDIAAENGQLRVLMWLRQHKVSPCDYKTCFIAARNGHLKVLKWLRKNNCSWNEWTIINAAINGYLKIVKWARENGCPWSELTCAEAAKNGQLEVLKWLHKNGCPWSEVTCAEAASQGHLEVLKWLHENGCPWDEKACNLAAYNGHTHILKYLKENNCPWDGWNIVNV